MPVTLPPLSRRQFLTRSLLAGAGLLLAPQAFALPSNRRDPNTWALFSDIHIAADPKRMGRDINMTEHFQAVTKELLAWPTPPAGLLVCGDCAHLHGKPEDYTQLSKLLAPIRADGMPVHLTLGNHDDRKNFRAGLKEARRDGSRMKDHQTLIVKTPHANWFMLDSLETTNKTPGRLAEKQREWLAKALDANDDKPALIFVHHQPEWDNQGSGLLDTKELFEILRPRKQVKAYLYGHTHRWHHMQEESGIHIVNLPSTAYIFDEKQPAGWVVSTLAPDGAKLELRSLDPTHPEHGKVLNLKWRT